MFIIGSWKVNDKQEMFIIREDVGATPFRTLRN